MEYKKIIACKIGEALAVEIANLEEYIEVPPKPEMGDYAFPCFKLSKVLKKSPNIIAEELKQSINLEGFEKLESLGPYLNFFVDKGIFTKSTIEEILNSREDYGRKTIGQGKNIVVEYSSPNIAKPFHIGHLCTTAIGDALYKMLSFQGYNCIRVNHLGDWGTQFGKLITAYKKGWADEERLIKEPISELLKIYVKFHEEAEKDKTLEDTARKHFKNLEDGVQEEVELWTKFKELSLVEFNRVYEMLKVDFDSYNGESFYSDKMEAVVEEIDRKGLLVESNGAKVVMLEDYNMPPCIIKKSDGATIYATRDLAAAIYRKNTYDFYKNIYVVGTPQALHFKQVFTALKLMGYEWAEDCIHVGFGLVKFADQKLSTRTGNVVFLEELLKEAVSKSLEIINEKNPSLENKEEVAQKLGIGAIKFTFLKSSRERDIVFDWKEMLSFEGESGPYVQYTYARGQSILKKSNALKVGGNYNKTEPNYNKIETKEEFELVKLLEGFPNLITQATDKLEPSVITRAVVEIAKAFNRFYNSCDILKLQDESLSSARLKLVEASCIVMKIGLKLLGIEVVDRM